MSAADWMARLPQEVKDAPFFRLAIPGSHDSLSYSIRADAPLAADCPDAVRILERLFGPVTRSILFKWSVTQSLSLSEQLQLGVRYLDLRLAMPAEPRGAARGKETQPHVVHHLCGDDVGPLLADADAFLAAHPLEVLIVDLQHFYHFCPDDHQQLVNHLSGLFGDRLCPYWPGATQEISLSWMQAHGYQVVLVYRCEEVRGLRGVWPGEALASPWPDVRKARALLGFLERGLAARDRRCGHVAQCVLTPRTGTVLPAGLCSDLHSGLAARCNKAVVPWLRARRQQRDHLNVAIADFVDAAFVDAVLNLNSSNPAVELPKIADKPHADVYL
ncbi:PI-PLC X domain-containing protein 3 [Cloeon dipterum]|uniref:PI-PLC X domain-containing protein 3 n=1 Tax=Cloeon dipterum TaxID=197152 RepID=UPI00321FF371